ncbi:hypothetical protein KJ632_04580, partial [Patescibacteria group bacterium]|nr:hypothetical protein [Patescibacteria group bacterium]
QPFGRLLPAFAEKNQHRKFLVKKLRYTDFLLTSASLLIFSRDALCKELASPSLREIGDY